VEELTRLPGIGETLAQRIVAYRQEHGPFRSVDELKNVPGIGEKTVEEIKDSVSLGGP
ncbi:MAG TPA: helix-hairpin-helix domain-containing protein, partial [Candidatus Acetothermia bacterium]|nr:helix-hairpin-helix domain-containing protein [Candidatus Acetothermia bacterium]